MAFESWQGNINLLEIARQSYRTGTGKCLSLYMARFTRGKSSSSLLQQIKKVNSLNYRLIPANAHNCLPGKQFPTSTCSGRKPVAIEFLPPFLSSVQWVKALHKTWSTWFGPLASSFLHPTSVSVKAVLPPPAGSPMSVMSTQCIGIYNGPAVWLTD